ncbi:IS66 family insertion sequence element accessory protein TnpB [Citrobacter freundii]|nr:IS66 family insertion sequence element accessory protein TnpB [Citrobacter freundii]
MIPLPTGTKIWLVAGVTDMRNGFNGLAAKVQTTLVLHCIQPCVARFEALRNDGWP